MLPKVRQRNFDMRKHRREVDKILKKLPLIVALPPNIRGKHRDV